MRETQAVLINSKMQVEQTHAQLMDQNIFLENKFLDSGIQDVSMSISIVHSLIERSLDGDGDESDKHI